ncbi:MAG: YolD-like family protein [Clostridia bacterium]|nr:YolD-like family protein [Clostridia bacterium]
MVNREDRAKQFMPFDALKGLQEELRRREERRLRVDKHELTEEETERLNSLLTRLNKGDKLEVVYYKNGRYIKTEGTLKKLNATMQFIETENARIYFDDVFDIKILGSN